MYILCGRRAEKFFWPTYQRHLRIRAGRPADRCVYTHTHTHRDCWGDCLSTAVVQHSMSGVWSYNIIFHVAGRRSRSQSHKRTSLNIDGLESEREGQAESCRFPNLVQRHRRVRGQQQSLWLDQKKSWADKVNTTDRGVQHSSFFFSCYYYH
jgi:hypothetical protein